MMNQEWEISFFCDVLGKCHIQTTMLSPFDEMEGMMDPRLNSIVRSRSEVTIQKMIGNIESKTKYMIVDDFRLRYICIPLPILSEKHLLFIGPYLSLPPSRQEVLEIGERIGIPPHAQGLLEEYYLSLPVMAEHDKLFVLIDTLCERVWQTDSFAIVELNKNYGSSVHAMESALKGEGFDEIDAKIKMMEMRYSFENELIRAVILGQQHKESVLASAFNDQLFEKRASDPVRNAKNYCIIMNTLLRKAAEQGGVHPLHIDRMSSDFAKRIELLSDTRAPAQLMKEMFSSYCRLVYSHSMKKYSSIVKKTLLVIDSDISAELSLNDLAEKQGISAGYLATVFKKETGKTVSEYVKDKRMEYAMYLLDTTNLQIQTVALHCGIMDVQYFSKIFKKKTGKTPREYREDSRRK